MGPSLTLWLKEPLDSKSRRDLIDWLAERCDVTLGEGDFEFSLRISEWAAIGILSLPDDCVFGISLDESELQSGDDYSQVEYLPVQELAIWAHGEGEVSETAVGGLALLLMRKLRAVVDFDGLLGPNPWASEGIPGEFERHLHEVRPFLDPIPGRLKEVGYMMQDGSLRYVHVADATFLESWLKHPAFHLLKEWQ